MADIRVKSFNKIQFHFSFHRFASFYSGLGPRSLHFKQLSRSNRVRKKVMNSEWGGKEALLFYMAINTRLYPCFFGG